MSLVWSYLLHNNFQFRLNNGDTIAGHILASTRVVIIDEVHRNLEWNEKILNVLTSENPDASVIGLTATPLRRERHETMRLAEMFDENAISPVKGEIPIQTFVGMFS